MHTIISSSSEPNLSISLSSLDISYKNEKLIKNNISLNLANIRLIKIKTHKTNIVLWTLKFFSLFNDLNDDDNYEGYNDSWIDREVNDEMTIEANDNFFYFIFYKNLSKKEIKAFKSNIEAFNIKLEVSSK